MPFLSAEANHFVSHALFYGRRLRALTVVDAYTHEALAIDADQGIKDEQVVQTMMRIAALRVAPKAIRVVNGPELVFEDARPLGVRKLRHARLLTAGKADGYCLRGVVQ